MEHNLHLRNVRAAGAYVQIGGLYAFALGWKLFEGKIPVFRIGGHREGRETGWQCAAREATEEACLQIEPLEPCQTFVVYPNGQEIDRQSLDRRDVDLHPLAWDGSKYPGPQPLLAAVYRKNRQTSTSLMYLAQSGQMPTPSAVVRCILLMQPGQVQHICRKPTTLAEYLLSGGHAIGAEPFDNTRILEPFLQARVLAQLFRTQPGLVAG